MKFISLLSISCLSSKLFLGPLSSLLREKPVGSKPACNFICVAMLYGFELLTLLYLITLLIVHLLSWLSGWASRWFFIITSSVITVLLLGSNCQFEGHHITCLDCFVPKVPLHSCLSWVSVPTPIKNSIQFFTVSTLCYHHHKILSHCLESLTNISILCLSGESAVKQRGGNWCFICTFVWSLRG